jgi:hypothetical protein
VVYWYQEQEQEQETEMSSLIAFTFDPLNEVVRRAEWDKFTDEHVLVFCPGNGMFYQDNIEVEYTSKRHISFSTNSDQDARDNQLLLALTFWKKFGGSMHASPEIRAVILDLIANNLR